MTIENLVSFIGQIVIVLALICFGAVLPTGILFTFYAVGRIKTKILDYFTPHEEAPAPICPYLLPPKPKTPPSPPGIVVFALQMVGAFLLLAVTFALLIIFYILWNKP